MKIDKIRVVADCETFRHNLNNQDKRIDMRGAEYSVSYAYDDKHGYHEGVVNRWTDLINLLEQTGHKYFQIYCHNGQGFDFWYLRRALMEDYGVNPKNEYMKNSVNHTYETTKKQAKQKFINYILERHIKARSKVDMFFRINGVTYETIDTYPKFMMSLKVMGEKLELAGVHQHKQEYKKENYNKFDLGEALSLGEKRKYQKKCFDSLTQEDKDYVMNDTRTLYQACKNYNNIMNKSYDFNKMTLSQNIGEQYDINDWAGFQIFHKLPQDMIEDNGLPKGSRLEFSNYKFMKNPDYQAGTVNNNKYLSMYDYLKHFYNGGLNAYNDVYVGKTIKPKGYIKHIDLNSSYPTVMYYEKFPVELVDYKIAPTPDKKFIELDGRFQYCIHVDKRWLDDFMSDIDSHMAKAFFVKYLQKPQIKDIFLTDVHLRLINRFKKHPKRRLRIPYKSYMKWVGKRFAGKSVIKENYKVKTDLKKKKEQETDPEKIKEYELMIANAKITLNGIYGIPALRAYFPNFQVVDGEWINVKDDEGHLGFKNSERDIVFSVFTTAYALKNLLTPLTYNVSGIDKGFIYADTDSIFMTNEYWDSIKDHVKLNHYDLGYWDMEHDNITAIHVLNHKKYAIQYYNKKQNKQVVEVHCGGVRLEDLHADRYDNLDDFVKEVFHAGSKVTSQRSILTKECTIVIYDGETELQCGGKYPDKFYHFKNKLEEDKWNTDIAIYLDALREDVENNGASDSPIKGNEDETNPLYYETPFGTFSMSDLFNTSYKSDSEIEGTMKDFLEDQGEIMSYLRRKEEVA